MILFIRGHIRNSLDDMELYNFIKKMEDDYGMIFDIYIHTWNIKRNSISWTNVTADNTPVTKPFIRKYFKNLKSTIHHIIIDDDRKIKLHGKTEGNINNGLMPLIGWKNYWYGKHKMVKYLHDNIKNENVVSIRFDFFQYSPHVRKEQLIDFIITNHKNKLSSNVFFFRNEQDYCIDNIYIGNIHTMYRLCDYFHNSLDEILRKHPDIKNQEFLVPIINNELFSKQMRKTKTRRIHKKINNRKSRRPK